MNNSKPKIWKVGVAIFVLFLALTIYFDFMEIEPGWFSMLIGQLNLPGIILYIITSGDVHGSTNGPYGQFGRILIITIGSSLFWYLLTYIVFKISMAVKSNKKHK